MFVTKSELIEKLADQQGHLRGKTIERLVKELLEQMVVTLANGEHIEVRGFGSISLHYRSARIGRNPKTGEKVNLRAKCVPHFKPGRELRARVNNSR